MKRFFGTLMVIIFTITSIGCTTPNSNSTSFVEKEEIAEEETNNLEENSKIDVSDKTNKEILKENHIEMIFGIGEIVTNDESNKNNYVLDDEIDESTKKIIENSDKLIVDYMKDHDVDVAEKLKKHKISLFNECLVSTDIHLYGYYDIGTENICLNRGIIDDPFLLEFVYTHEAIHYLGCADHIVNNIYEGMANAIAEDILGYGIGNYYYATILAHQILDADSKVINYIFTGGNLNERIDTRLEDVKRIWKVKENDHKISDVLNVMLDMVLLEDARISTITGQNALKQAQNIVEAYIKTF